MTRKELFEQLHKHQGCETPATCFDSFNWGYDEGLKEGFEEALEKVSKHYICGLDEILDSLSAPKAEPPPSEKTK